MSSVSHSEAIAPLDEAFDPDAAVHRLKSCCRGVVHRCHSDAFDGITGRLNLPEPGPRHDTSLFEDRSDSPHRASGDRPHPGQFRHGDVFMLNHTKAQFLSNF